MTGSGARRRVRVKFCGITRAEDARAAADLGADAIGLIFYPPSPRSVSVEQALNVLAGLPPLVTTVGVFVDPTGPDLEAVLTRVPLDLLQFHGQEDPALCSRAGRPWIKAIGMREGVDVRTVAGRYPEARAVLLDTFSARSKGGTGRAFDWSMVPGDLDHPVILAGGLGPGNVATAIRTVRPFAVDVNGGVESTPGMKDVEKMRAFMKEVDGAQSPDPPL